MNATTLTWTSYVFSAFLCFWQVQLGHVEETYSSHSKVARSMPQLRKIRSSLGLTNLTMTFDVFYYDKNEAASVLWQCESFGCSCGKLLRSTCVAKDPQFHGFIMTLTAWFMKHCLGLSLTLAAAVPRCDKVFQLAFPLWSALAALFYAPWPLVVFFKCLHSSVSHMANSWHMSSGVFLFCGATMLYTLTLCSSKEILQK